MQKTSKRKRLLIVILSLILVGCVAENLDDLSTPITLSTFPGTTPENRITASIKTKVSTNTLAATKTPKATEVFGTQTPNPFFTPTPTAFQKLNKSMNPLTGQIVESFEELYRRPVMVKISNFPREIRPQSGLSKADIVFEHYIGQGMNRFTAIFYGDNAEWAGPIRSARLIDAQLAQMYQGILVYGGADERVNAIITAPDILGSRAIDTRTNDACPPICGEDTHSAEGVFVDTAALTDYAVKIQVDENIKTESLHTMDFSNDLEIVGKEANQITIDISEVCKSRWIYDSLEEKYFRWEETGDFENDFVKTNDALVDGEQLAYDNIVVLFSDYVVYDMLLHDVELVYGEFASPALMFRDGDLFEGTWTAKGEDAPLQVLYQDSTYFYKPGKTWFIFVTKNSEFKMEGVGEYYLTFQRP